MASTRRPGPQLLPPESLAIAHRGAAQAAGLSYAMGWREGTTAGLPSHCHDGSLPSYRGWVALLPQSRSAVIVPTNSSSQFADHTREIAAGIVALLEKRPLPQGFRRLRTTDAVIAVLCLAVVALQARSLWRAIQGEGIAPARSAVLRFDFALAIAAILALPPCLTKISYRATWKSAPGVVATAVVLLLTGLTTGVLKLRRTLQISGPIGD